MGSPEMHRPQEPFQPEPGSGSLRSSLGRHINNERQGRPGQEWMFALLKKVRQADNRKLLEFINALPEEDREPFGDHLLNILAEKGDHLWQSRSPQLELNDYLGEAKQRLEAERENKEDVN